MADPFADFPDAPPAPGLPRIPVSSFNGAPSVAAQDEFADFPDAPHPHTEEYGPNLPSSSPEGAGFRRVVLGIVPAVASVPGMGLGAAMGTAAGALTSPVTGPVGPFVGGLAGGFAGGAEAANLADQAQNAAINKFIPPEIQKDLFIDPAQLQADEIRHPYASETGGIAAGGSVFKPGLIGKTILQKLGAALGFGALGGGMEAGHEMASGDTVDPGKIAIAAAGQAAMQKPTKLGEMVQGMLPSFMKPEPPPVPPPAPAPLLALPGPMHAEPMSDEAIAAAQAKLNQPPPGNPQGTPDLDKNGQPVRPAAPDKLYGQAGRAPQSSDDLVAQRQAADAFALAERQRQRLEAQPETLDTQAAGRPEGVNPQDVFLDQGFPVELQERRFVPDHDGKSVEVAKVQRYDPRTGEPDPQSIPYEVPVRDLKKAQYATPPRQAEDFIDRAEGPPSPENPRMPQQPVSREPNQTFRATPADDNTQFPGAGIGRSPFPEQPEGPGPWKSASDAEAWFQAEQERRARGDYTAGEQEQEQAAQDAYKDAPAGNTPNGKADGRNWDTDEFGYVKSNKGGPIRFPDALSAAKWILKRGQADTDQMMEPAVHPSGKGYTVKERMRTQAPPPETEATPETLAEAAPGEPRALPGPGVEKPVEEPVVSRETISENSKNEKPTLVNPYLSNIKDARQRAEVLSRHRPDDDVLKGINQTFGTEHEPEGIDLAKQYFKWLDKDSFAFKAATAENAGSGFIKKAAALVKAVQKNEGKIPENAQPRSEGNAENAPPKKPVARESLANLKQVPLSFASWLQRIGGIKDTGGELRAMDIENHKSRRIRNMVNNDTGNTPDQVRERAVEYGFIKPDSPDRPNESSINDVFDLIAHEAEGRKQYSLRDPRVEDYRSRTAYDAGKDADQQQQYEDDLRISAKANNIALSDEEIATIKKDYYKDDPSDAIDDYLEDQSRQTVETLTSSHPPETDIPFNEENDHGPHDDTRTAGTDEPGAQGAERSEDAAGSQEEAERGADRSAEGADAAGPEGGESGPDASERGDESVSGAGTAGSDAGRGEHPESLNIPGTAEESARTRAARNADRRMRSDKTQKSHDFGLFDHENESALASQKDMFGAEEEVTPENVHRVPRGTTLYSGLPLPEISRAIADTTRWAFGDHQEFARNLDGLWKAIKNTQVKAFKRNDALIHFLRLINGSSSADIRSLARQVKSPTLNAMIDHFSKVPGSSRAVGEIYDAAVYRERNQRTTAFEKALAPILKDDKAVRQAVNQVRSGKIGGGAIGKAAQGIRDLLDGLHKYMKDAGVDIGFVKNHFPRSFDPLAVMKDPEGFIRAAEGEFKKKGLDNYKDAAQGLHDEMIFGNNGSIFTGRDSLGKADFVKQRVFDESVDQPGHPLNKFLIHDPVQSLAAYIHSAVKRAEVARRFGDNFSNWKDIEQAVTNEGGAPALKALRDYTRQMTVMRGAPAGSGLYRMESMARTWTILARLSHTFRTIVMEPLNSGVYTGNPVNGLLSLGNAVRDLARDSVPTGKKLGETRELGEFMGVVGPKLFDALGESQWGGGPPVGRLQQVITQKFLRHTGVAQIGESRLTGAQGISQAYIRLQAQRLLKNTGKLPGELLADMGVPHNRHQEFSAWLMKQHDGNPSVEDMRKGGEMAKLYRTAIGQAIRGQTMIPTNGSRPAWKTSSPLGRVMGQLSAYSHEYFEQVWMRSLRLAKRGASEEGFTPIERARMMMPLASLPMVAAGAYLSRKASNAVLNGPDQKAQSEEEQIKHAAMLGVPFAPIEPVLQGLDNMQFGKSPVSAIEGPGLGLLNEASEAGGIGYRKAIGHPRPGDTRKAANMLYTDILAPAANMLMSTVSPVSPASVIGLQALNSNRARDMFTDSIVGSPKNKGGGESAAPGRNGGGRNGGARNGGARNGGARNGGARNGGARNGGGRL